jgi:hypothetical protein
VLGALRAAAIGANSTARLKGFGTAFMGDETQKSGPRKGKKGEAAERERRRRQAEQLRANLLKRKEQSRGRIDRADPAGNSDDDPAGG